jgi:uncharacterized protein YodC (DUF2158 family)
MSKFQIGSFAWVKSGSPKMTVQEIDDNIITCIWFDGAKKYHDAFIEDVLTDKDPNPPSIPSIG